MGLGGVGGVSTSCEASIGMVVLQFGDFAPFQAGKSVPAMVDCLSFCPKPLPSVLTHIYYKKVQTILQRSPVKWRVVVQPSQEYSVAPSDMFIPLVPSRRATIRMKVSNQSKCLDESPE
jgi:hypothetical protein